MSEIDILLEQVSPNGNVVAIVEQGDGCCYFYLKGEGEFGVRSCWMRNLAPAPEVLDVQRMRDGRPPLLPRSACAHPNGAAPCVAADLSVVWAEEGDAAAVFERDSLVAVIPVGSGCNNFSGFSRDCVSETPLCWPLGTPATNDEHARYARAREWWERWERNESPWTGLQESFLSSVESALGPRANYYAIDGGNWPPKGMVRVEHATGQFLITIGVALRPQPGAEIYCGDPRLHRRIELGVRLPREMRKAEVEQIAGYLSGQTNLPWNFHTYLAQGHTLPADVFETFSAGRFSRALLLKEPQGFPVVPLPEFRGDPVSVLWVVPISEQEQAFAETAGSGALYERRRARQPKSWHWMDRESVA